jgi:hypothetical protein
LRRRLNAEDADAAVQWLSRDARWVDDRIPVSTPAAFLASLR